jgi:phage gp46-like protein
MTRFDLDDVGQKIQQAAQSYVERALAKAVDDAELRIAQQLANTGKPQLAIDGLSLTFLDLGARVDDLERAKEIRQATPEQYAEHAREWVKDFPGSEPPPTIWSISRPEPRHK